MSEASIKCIHLVYFSPSGSTEKIVRKIATGIQGLEVKTYNLLPSAARKQQYVFGKDDLVIYGSLAARMPTMKQSWWTLGARRMKKSSAAILSCISSRGRTGPRQRRQIKSLPFVNKIRNLTTFPKNGGPRKYLLTASNAKPVFVTVPWMPSTSSRKNLTLTAVLLAMAA